MTQNGVINAYFEWMYDLVCHERFAREISYRKLLMQLHNTEFIYSIPMDENRYEDGVSLRHRFAYAHPRIENAESYLIGPCSVLEMMIALVLHSESIMDDTAIGDRTGQWFWNMVTSLGLGGMSDANYDKRYVTEVLDRFLNREYAPNGEGGLFTIKRCQVDLRNVEIWHQLCWYLDSITHK